MCCAARLFSYVCLLRRHVLRCKWAAGCSRMRSAAYVHTSHDPHPGQRAKVTTPCSNLSLTPRTLKSGADLGNPTCFRTSHRYTKCINNIFECNYCMLCCMPFIHHPVLQLPRLTAQLASSVFKCSIALSVPVCEALLRKRERVCE